MLKGLKALFDRNKRYLESYGGEATRNTYIGQLNFESGKIFFVTYITFFVWLPYIFNDLKLHQYPTLAVGLRITLSVISAIFIALRLTRTFKNRPGILLVALMTYLYLGTSLLTATAGERAPSYVGGFAFIIMLPVFAPFPFKFKAVTSLASVVMFFVIGMFTGLDFADNSVLYAANDLLSSVFVGLLLSASQERLRFDAWKQQQRLNDMVNQQEKNLATIFKLAREAETASKTKSDFLANMSHEIRTPMNAIIGISELMMQKNIPPDIYEDALAIKNAGNNLLAIINDILDITKIESGKIEIVPAEYSFASVFHDVCSIIRTRVSEKDVLFLTFVDSRLPNLLFGDGIRVRQILLNLLSNAVKYTEKGYISISVEGEISNGSVNLDISVSDSGIGIREEDIEKLFNKFVQVDTHKNRGIEGTGLGLAISRQLCRIMGGDIEVASEYGKGSVFTMRLSQKIVDNSPIAVVKNPKSSRSLLYELRPECRASAARTFDNLNVPYKSVNTQAAFISETKTGKYHYAFVPMFLYDDIVERSLRVLGSDTTTVLLADFGDAIKAADTKMLSMPISCFTVAGVLNNEEIMSFNESKEILNSFSAPDARILIVDDIPVNLKVAEGLMAHFKMQIDTCLSGREAISLATQNEYDIIFLDHMMPEMDGIEAAGRIRAMGGKCETLPIIALTANAVSGMREMFIANGMSDFLAKPIEVSKLNSILMSWLPKEKLIKRNFERPREDSPAFEIDGVDIGAGIRQSGGTREIYLEVLHYFHMDASAKLREIPDSLERGDIKLYTICVHSIKGAAANIGADKLSDMAKALEAAASSGDMGYIDENTAVFLSELEKITNRISAFLQKNAPQRESGGSVSADVLEKLEKLRSALLHFNTDSVDDLLNSLKDGAAPDFVDELSRNILLFDYSNAISLIDGLIGAKEKDEDMHSTSV